MRKCFLRLKGPYLPNFPTLTLPNQSPVSYMSAMALRKGIFLVSQGHSFTIVLIFTFEIRGFSLPFLYTRWGLSLRSFCVRPYKSLRSIYRRNKAEKGFGLPALFCRLLSLDGNRSKTVAPSKVFSNVLIK